MASKGPATPTEGAQSATVNTQTSSKEDVGKSGHVEMETLSSHGASSAQTQSQSKPEDAERTAPVVSDARETSTLTAKGGEGVGDSIEAPAPESDSSPSTGTGKLSVQITLLLTNGNRHPFKIDNKYLQKRDVHANDNDPYEISVYNLKELIWKDWRDEWETRPSSPGYIRLIHFGRLLEDKSVLKDCRFNMETPNVLHMTIKPQEIVEEEEVKKKEGSRRGNNSNRGGANCCVIL